MSILVGPVAGALVAGGFYYGFSNLITTRTAQHRNDLHLLSSRLADSPTLQPGPVSAASRIEEHQFASLLQSRWNTQLESLFRTMGEWDDKLVGWGRKTLYGGDATVKSESRS